MDLFNAPSKSMAKTTQPQPQTDIHVTLFYSPAPRHGLSQQLKLPAGSSLQSALVLSGLQARWQWPADAGFGVWNKLAKAPANTLLVDGDRVEIYRPLRVDPMTARRERFKTQGARSAGLFAQRRPGAKPGY
jgi:putative ubiquitin-RnfH superfamily antitoxin RatB of RatAB toxin-antitoxin module